MDKSGSKHVLWTYPTPSRTNPTPNNFVFHKIILNTNFSIFFSRFSITIIFVYMLSLRYKKKYIPPFSLYDSITFNIVKTSTLCSQNSTQFRKNQNFVLEPLEKNLILTLTCGGYKQHWNSRNRDLKWTFWLYSESDMSIHSTCSEPDLSMRATLHSCYLDITGYLDIYWSIRIVPSVTWI